jgi:hypothetical protein
MFFALDTTGHTITRYQWVLLPMPPAVIARVNLFGENEPSILAFTNRHGREIGDHPHDYEPSSFNALCNILTHVLLFEFITTDLLKMSGVATA